MADIQSNIEINIDTSQALSSIKLLQSQISAFNTQMAKSGAAANAAAANMQQNLINSINQTGKFSAQMKTIKSTTESFTNALEKNQLSMREYFRYAGASTKTFGKLFKTEFDTITKVSRERVKDLQTQYIKMGRDANGAMRAIAVRPLALDMDNLATKTALAAQKQAVLNQLLKQGSTNLLNFGKNTQWAGRQLMVGFTVPLTMLGTAAAKTFMQLEEQAIKFKRVYGDMATSTEDTNKMLKEIEILAKGFTKYGVAVADTMEMAAQAAATGKMNADLIQTVANATKLAVLGGVEQAAALETTISLTNAFGVSADVLANKIDFLNAVENQTVVSIEDLTTAIPKAGPVIQQLGGTVEDLAFFLTAMKEGGINASEGANALKSGLASLINPTNSASKMLAGFGINIKGIVEANKGDIKNTVIGFAQALDKIDPLNRARAIEQLFGKFQFARISTLFKNVVAEGSQANRVLSLTNATTEELAILSERELSKVQNSTTYKFKKTMEDLKVAVAPIGEQFLKAITPIAEFIGKILEKFNGLGDSTKKWTVLITALLAGVGPIFLMTFGLIANGAANIIKLFVNMKSVFNRMGTSSKDLGAQTQYLTSQQIEAAAVASSLEQVHSQLTQAFSSEATAINQLISAYQRAVIAQRSFTGPVGMPNATRPKKMAVGGILRGPGTGTSDSIPVMASNGEAIIPAANVKKYPGLTAGLVAGNIPGFMSGTVNVARTSQSMDFARKTTSAKIQALIDGSLGQIDDVIAAALQNLSSETRVSLEKFKAEVRTQAEAMGKSAGPAFASSDYATRTKSYNARGAGERRTLPVQLAEERGSQSAAAELARADAAAKAIAKKMEELGATAKEITAATQIDRAHVIELTNEQKLLKDAWSSDLWVAQTGAENNLSNSLKSSERNRKVYLDYLEKSNADQEMIFSISDKVTKGTGLNEQELQVQGDVLRRISKDMDNNVIAANSVSNKFKIYASAVAEGAQARAEVSQVQGPDILKQTQRTQAEINNGLAKIVKELPEGAKQALRVKSPSQEMRTVGQETGRGAIIGFEEFIDDMRVAGEKMGAAATGGATSTGIKSQAQLAKESRQRLYGTGPVDAEAKSLRKQMEQRAKYKLLEEKRQFTQGQIAAGTPGGVSGFRTSVGDRFKSIQGKFSTVAGKIPPGSIGKGAMGATAAVSMATMIPGAVGDAASKIVGPMMALTTILPLLTSAVGAVTVAIGVLALAMYSWRKSFDKAQDEALQFGETMGTTNSAMKKFGEASGKVSATEIMDRRRKDKFKVLDVVPGKSSFGESFMQSEAGKEMQKNVGSSIKSSGYAGTKEMVANQLMTAIASGSMSASQARSVAASLGEQLGDYNFGIEINGKISELIGPNGENLERQPLEVRMRMIEDSRSRASGASTTASNSGAWNSRDIKNTGRAGVAGYIAGGAVGAAVGSAVPVIGTAIGAVAGAIIGGVAGAFIGNRDRQKRVGQTAGASVAMDKMALEQGRQLLDSFDLQYQKKIELLKAQGKINEAVKLENQYYADREKLVAANQATKQQILDSYTKSEGATKSAYETGIDKAITKKYKGTIMEDMVPLATQQIADSQLSQEQKMSLKLDLETGEMDPLAIINLFNTLTEQKDQELMLKIIATNSGKFGQETTQLLGAFTDGSGKIVPALQSKYLLNISTKTGKEAQDFQNFFIKLTKMKNVIPASISVDYYLNNPAVMAETQAAIDKIEATKGSLSTTIAIKYINDPEAAAVFQKDLDYYNKLPDEQKKVYAAALEFLLSVKGDPAEIKKMNDWLAANPGKTNIDYYTTMAQRVVTEGGNAPAVVPPVETPSGGTQSNPWAFLDDVVKKLKQTRNAAIDATKPLQVLKNLVSGSLKLDSFGKGFNDQFRGITQSGANAKSLKGVAGLNPNETLLGALNSLDPKDFNKIKKDIFVTDKNGNIIGFKPKGLGINQFFNEAALGDYTDNLSKTSREMEDQKTAYVKLTSAGVDAAQALNITSDAALAAAIASTDIKKGSKEWDAFIKKIKTAKEELKNKERFDIGKNLEAGNYKDAFSAGYEAIQNIFSIQSRLIDLKYKGDRDLAANAVRAAESEVAANNFKISQYQYGLDNINQSADEITKKYDAQFVALDKVRAINEQISQQKQSQIDLASSLAKGDIASAARAMETLRQQRANAALESSRKAMEQQRDTQIAGLTDTKGRTKAEIEKEITTLTDKNRLIQYQTIDPLNEQLRLLDEKATKEKESLTVAGKSKDAWDAIALKVDASEVATGKFDTAIAGALSTATALEKKWGDIAKAFDAYKSVTAGVAAEQAAIDKNNLDNVKPPVVAPPVVAPKTTPASTVTVKSGNTLSGIAKAAGVSLSTVIKANPQITNPNLIKPGQKINIPAIAKSEGGIVPSYFAAGGYGKGTDTIPAMLTPGEFVVRKYAVDNFGIDNLKSINNGTYAGNSVYNYNLSVNVGGSNTSADDIARTVMSEIRRSESQRVRGIK